MLRYQEIRLRRGNARSGAPIISGSRTLPNVVGIEGTRKYHTMITPCMVKSLFYMLSERNVPCGVISSRRTRPIATPPIAKKNVMDSA